MSYEPTNWKAGDTVTSAKLNKIEQGIASNNGNSSDRGNVIFVNFVAIDGGYRLDKTVAEIVAAAETGVVVGINTVESTVNFYLLVSYSLAEGDYYLEFWCGPNPHGFSANSMNDYPNSNDIST